MCSNTSDCQTSDDVTRLTVLIVDDDPKTRAQLRSILEATYRILKLKMAWKDWNTGVNNIPISLSQTPPYRVSMVLTFVAGSRMIH